MTTFSFSTGNPSNLVGGATASMTDLSGSLTDIKTFLNGGSITDTNVSAAGLTDTSLASPTNTVWRPVMETQGVVSGMAGAVYYFATSPGVIAASGATAGSIGGLWNAPVAADVAVAGKTTRLRVRINYVVNGTGPGVTMTWGLYPVTSTGGGSGLLAPTLGTVVTGSTVAAASPAAGASAGPVSSSFDLSTLTAGNLYVAGITNTGTQAAASVVGFKYQLDMRHT